MKEDVLEQVVDDYLQAQGYFTTHNVRFNPSKNHPDYVSRNDSVSSDVDVVGYHPRRTGPDRVMAVSCKSWQTGFGATRILAQLRGEAPNPKRPQELRFRELWLPKWSQGFRRRIEELTRPAAVHVLPRGRVREGRHGRLGIRPDDPRESGWQPVPVPPAGHDVV